MKKILLTNDHEFPNGKPFQIRYVRSSTENFNYHSHEFYEVFLVKEGKLSHRVNDTVQTLEAGSLLFVRDFDTHYYSNYDSEPFEFINLSFKAEILDALFAYLGKGFPSETLLTSATPPIVILLPDERERLLLSLLELNSGTDSCETETKIRVLLLNIFTKYFHNYSLQKSDIPLWLEIAYEKMKSPSNFIVGEKRLLAIAGKSREHISRSMRKYYNITPSEFISDLRMTYAVNLMQTSNLSITDICFECGFSNLSWFYKLFESKYGTTPAKYKRSRSRQH